MRQWRWTSPQLSIKALRPGDTASGTSGEEAAAALGEGKAAAPLEQWFQLGVLHPGDIYQCQETILFLPMWHLVGRGRYAAEHPTVPRMGSDLAPNAHNAEVLKHLVREAEQ